MPYARHLGNQRTSRDLKLFEELLARPDPLLMDWFMHRSIPESARLAALVSDILRFSRASNLG